MLRFLQVSFDVLSQESLKAGENFQNGICHICFSLKSSKNFPP